MSRKKVTILLVEDERYIMKLLSKRLIDAGFTVIKAVDGEEGLSKALVNHPDLIILDILMPKMDGITMAKKLREDKWGKNAQIMLLTNLTSKMDEAYDLGIDEYIIKSNINLDSLISGIKAKVGC